LTQKPLKKPTSTPSPTLSAYEIAEMAANLAESKKAENIDILEVGPVSTLSDYFVICSGESSVQIKALESTLLEKFKKLGLEPVTLQRQDSREWLLIDFGDVVIHLFHKNAREFYQLERFWSHARRIPRQNWLWAPQRQVS